MTDEQTPVTWCTECGEGLTKDGYCTACLIQEIDTLNANIVELTENIEVLQEDLAFKESKAYLKSIAADFYYWWHNQPGANTMQGFDEWWDLVRSTKGG